MPATTFEDFMNERLPDFVDPPLTYPSARGGATSTWAMKNLGGVTLSAPQDAKTWGQLRIFIEHYDSTQDKGHFQPGLRKLLTTCPKSEGDIVAAVGALYTQCTFEIAVAHRWFQSTLLQLEVLAESYTKGPEINDAIPESEPATGTGAGRTRAETVGAQRPERASDLAGALVGAGAPVLLQPGSSPQPNIQSGSVRVDVNFVLRPTVNLKNPDHLLVHNYKAENSGRRDDTRMTRNQKADDERQVQAEKLRAKVKRSSAIACSNQYTPWGQLGLLGYDIEENNFVIPLFDMELKRFNHLDLLLPDAFHIGQNAIGAADVSLPLKFQTAGTTGVKIAHLRGFHSILQQAMRYAYCYGSGAVYLTDYKHHIYLDTTDLVKKLTQIDITMADPKNTKTRKALVSSLSMQVPCIVTRKDDLFSRWLLAYVLKTRGDEIVNRFEETYKRDLIKAREYQAMKDKEAKRSKA
ncbi:hypothetical protein EUX98_g5294 [Antrodiella citrinella]|uniref:Uncharacterized protein n=1 Tax=Antrodiella citrinella TaxID=2447956 RepID=A0A4S4MRY9_9APHY|nr:hypothetical protein EUX98_g5294 [Antrodiella citrinella]